MYYHFIIILIIIARINYRQLYFGPPISQLAYFTSHGHTMESTPECGSERILPECKMSKHAATHDALSFLFEMQKTHNLPLHEFAFFFFHTEIDPLNHALYTPEQNISQIQAYNKTGGTSILYPIVKSILDGANLAMIITDGEDHMQSFPAVEEKYVGVYERLRAGGNYEQNLLDLIQNSGVHFVFTNIGEPYQQQDTSSLFARILKLANVEESTLRGDCLRIALQILKQSRRVMSDEKRGVISAMLEFNEDQLPAFFASSPTLRALMDDYLDIALKEGSVLRFQRLKE